MDSRAKFVVHGGRYNDIVVNSWRLSPEFLESMENHRRMSKPVAGETENGAPLQGGQSLGDV